MLKFALDNRFFLKFGPLKYFKFDNKNTNSVTKIKKAIYEAESDFKLKNFCSGYSYKDR